MRKFVLFFATLMACFLFLEPSFVLAQVADPGAIVPIPAQDFIGFLLQSLGGFKGASSLVVAGLVVQIIMKFLGTDIAGQLMAKLPGNIKIIIVTGLTLVSGVLGLMTVGGLSLGAALIHSATLSALMVFGNQIYKQFFVKSS